MWESLSNLAEEILSLIIKKGKVRISEIQSIFNLTNETTKLAVNFLVKFGFVRWDKRRRYVMLSSRYKRFLEEEDR